MQTENCIIHWLGNLWKRVAASFRGILLNKIDGARLVYAEKSFVVRHPVALSVRADRAYDDGVNLMLLELKARGSDTIYLSDVIELSAQRMAVQNATGRQVPKIGYVLLYDPSSGRRNLQTVKRMAAREVIQLVDIRKRILAGIARPRPATQGCSCHRCEYRAECHSTFASDR